MSNSQDKELERKAFYESEMKANEPFKPIARKYETGKIGFYQALREAHKMGVESHPKKVEGELRDMFDKLISEYRPVIHAMYYRSYSDLMHQAYMMDREEWIDVKYRFPENVSWVRVKIRGENVEWYHILPFSFDRGKWFEYGQSKPTEFEVIKWCDFEDIEPLPPPPTEKKV